MNLELELPKWQVLYYDILQVRKGLLTLDVESHMMRKFKGWLKLHSPKFAAPKLAFVLLLAC